MANDTQWDRVWELFEAALDVPAGERAAWVETAAENPRVAQEVRELLSAHVRDAGVLENPPQIQDEPQSELRRTRTSTPEAQPYRIVREIGRGGMGVVYLAEDPRLDRQVALKFLTSRLSSDPAARRRLLREARAASKLDHPNICTVYDVGEAADGRPFVAMAFYDGPTVAEMVEQQGKLTAECAVDVALQAARGIARAHAEGVIHRDIKPSNLLLDNEGVVRVLDFGVAKLAGATATDSGIRMGTPLYMAPEQIIGKDIGPGADLWALGVVLYEMVTGVRPFAAERELTAIYEILNEDPAPPSTKADLPAGLEPIILRLLEKKAQDRYPSPGDLVVDLVRLAKTLAPSGGSHNVPAERSRLIGRENEVGEIAQLFEQRRLITVTGPGGAGKTRLAREISRRSAEDVEAVFFVELAPIREAGLAPAAIAATIGRIDPTVAPLEGLKRWIGERRVLLTLDNFEQVLDAAPSVSELLTACPSLRVLVTSRAPLRVMGEQEYPLSPLATPTAETTASDLERVAAVALFVERAREVVPDFRLDDASATAVRRLCARLDGLPLAIELAAARVRMFPPAALLERLSASLDLLESRERDRPERHRTLRHAVAWSSELLDETSRMVFRRLGAFTGGASLEAVESLTGDARGTLEALDQLVEHSLVRRRDAGGRPRFYMLETIREQSADMLSESGEEEQAKEAHTRFFVDLAEQAAPQLTGPEQKVWLERIQADEANFRAALARATACRDAVTALRLVASLWRFWVIRSNVDEALERCRAVFALNLTETEARLRADACHGYANLAHYRGQNALARDLADRSIDIWRQVGDLKGLAAALTNRAWVSCETSRLDEARTLSLEALALHEENDDRRGMALACNNLGWVALYRGLVEEALSWQQRGLRHRDEVGDRRGRAFALGCLAWNHRLRGSFDLAYRQIEESLGILEEIVDPTLSAWTLTVRAKALLDQDRRAEAYEDERAARKCWAQANHPIGLALCSSILGELLYRDGDLPRAETELERAREKWEHSDHRWGVSIADRRLALIAAARGETTAARSALRAGLEIALDLQDRLGEADCLETFAQLETAGEETLAALVAAGQIRSQAGAVTPPAAAETLTRLRQEAQDAVPAERARKILSETADSPHRIAARILESLA